jgi:signal transduction histidine kinase
VSDEHEDRRVEAAGTESAGVRRYVAGWVLMAVVSTVFVVVVDVGPGSAAAPLWVAVLCWFLMSLTVVPGLQVVVVPDQLEIGLAEIVVVPSIVLLNPPVAVAVVVGAAVVEQVLNRRRALKAVFNTAGPVVGVVAGSLSYHGLAGSAPIGSPRGVVAAVVAGGVLIALNSAAMAGLWAVLEPMSLLQALRGELPTALLGLCVAATGVVAAVVAVEAPAALPLIAVPSLLEWSRTRVVARARALELAKEHAEAANRAKSTFLSRVSHELRTPLNVILGYGQLLELDDARAAEERELVDGILRSGRHLLELIDEVLDMSRFDDGLVELDLAEIDLSSVLEASLGPVRRHAAARRIELVTRGTDHAVRAVADAARLEQVLGQLLRNAVVYDREGGTVTAEVAVSDGRALLSVTDTGPGIPEDEIERLFLPFERLSTSVGTSGTGLGLAIAKLVVAAMGGDLTVDSAPGGGATFTVALPLTSVDLEVARV